MVIELFQSPCGVLGVCRGNGPSPPAADGVFQSPCGVLGVCRHNIEQKWAEIAGVSVPLRGFRGLQERIAKTTRVVWLPYPAQSLHSSCIVVHVFLARHPAIAPFPPFPHPVFATRQTPRKWPRVAKRFRTRFGRP